MNNQVFNGKGAEITIEAFHPGIFLLEEIEERELLKKDVAKALDLLPNNLSQIFNGKRNISAQLAIKLEKYLKGISADNWYGLQSVYDLQQARMNELLAESLLHNNLLNPLNLVYLSTEKTI